MSKVIRHSRTASAAIHTSLGSCDAIDLRNVSGVLVLIPAGITSITIYASQTSTGTFTEIDNVGTNGVVTVTASKWYIMPAEVFPAPFIKLKSGSGTGTADLCLKQ